MAVTPATALDGVADVPLDQQPSLPSPGAIGLAPFFAPVLIGTRTARAIALLARVAMAVWAYAIGVMGIRWDGDRAGVHRTVTAMTVAGIAIAVVWFASAAYWSVVRTRNVHRLDGRFPTVGRAVRSWVYPPVWIALMTATLVRFEPHPDFDVRPLIIVVGFVVAMVAPYRVVQRVFRSLVRVQPDAAVIVLYIVDTIAFGVIWWRLAEWPETAAAVDRTTVDLLGGSAFAAGVALLIGLWLSVYLDRETDRSEDIRVLALRTRHDHRLARLQGLDPMDRATRWALWLARQSADNRVVLGEPADLADELDADRPLAPAAFDAVHQPMVVAAPMPPPVIPTAPPDEPYAPTEPVLLDQTAPVESLADVPEHPVEDPVEVAVEDSAASTTAARLRESVLRALAPPEAADEAIDEAVDEAVDEADDADDADEVALTVDEAVTALPALPPRPAPPVLPVADPVEGPVTVDQPDAEVDQAGALVRSLQRRIGASEAGVEADADGADTVTRALQRRLVDAQRQAERTARRSPLVGRALVPDDTEVVSTMAERLAARLGADLERGGGSEFASRVRELSAQFHSEPSASSAVPMADPGDPDAAPPSRGVEPPRLMLVESCRLLALLLLAVAAAGMVWVLVLSAQHGAGPESTLDDIDVARSIAMHALGLSHVLVLAWLAAAAAVSSRIEASVRRWPYPVLAAVAAPFITGAVALEFGDAGRWSLIALTIATVSCAIGLKLIAFPNEMLGRPSGALNAWLVGVIGVLVVLVASPLTAPLTEDVARDSLAFGAIVAGLVLMVVAVLGGVVMSQFEDVLRSSAELAVERPGGTRRQRGARRRTSG